MDANRGIIINHWSNFLYFLFKASNNFMDAFLKKNAANLIFSGCKSYMENVFYDWIDLRLEKI